MIRQTLALAAVLSALGSTALASEMSLSIKDGRVTLVADNVPVRQILAEWSRVGQTRIVNGERVSGPPVTLRLQDVPERQALDTILRSVAGYMAAPRPGAALNASIFDRILIMPTSSPAPPAAGPAGPSRPPGPNTFVQPQPPAEVPAEEVEEQDVPEEENQAGAPQFDPNATAGVPFIPRRPDGTPLYPGPQPNTSGVPDAGAPFTGPPGTTARPGEMVPQAPQNPAVPGPSPAFPQGQTRPGVPPPPPNQ